jgi:Protein of unknown function (DUF3307)
MTETLIALSFAHVLADFILQTNWMAANKRNPLALGTHILIVWGTAMATTGSLHWGLAVLAGAHLCLDAGKAWAPWKGLAPFLLDQALHAASLVAVALWVPDLWAIGLWGAPAAGGWTSALWASPAGIDILPAVMVTLTGFIVATRAGGFAIGLFMAQWTSALPVEGLKNGGRAIGLLERGLIFLLVIVGLPEGIGFLIAAKSVLRFGAVGDDRAFSEYVIIGTLASFAWAITASFLTVIVLQAVSPIGIPDLSP